MRRSLVRRAVGVGLALAVSAPLVLSATAAGADTITAGGSDTTQDVMDALAPTLGIVNVKVPPNQLTPITVPGDAYCNTITYKGNGTNTLGAIAGDGTVNPPFGSGQGKTALTNSVAKSFPNNTFYPSGITFGGCIDIARSSSAVGSSPAQFEGYAFALDAVGWGSPSLLAPPSMSLQQLRDIYACNVNDWSEVGGRPGPIVRVLPQSGSGTRDFFLVNVLGQTAAYIPPLSGTGGHTCSAHVDANIEENNGQALLTASTRADNQKYILPYSAGKWVYQANNSGNPTLEKRGGVRPGGLVNNDAVTGVPGAPAAWAMRWVGSQWRLNDATIIDGRSVPSVTADAAFDTTLTGPAGSFTAADIGRTVAGAYVNDGTVITAVNGDGSVATITPGTKATTAFSPYPSTQTLTVGWSVISEFNPHVDTPSNIKYPGVRYVYNILHSDSPSYTQARDAIGFADAPGGTVSLLCNGSSAGTINSNGFLALPLLDRDGAGTGNDTPRSCVLKST